MPNNKCPTSLYNINLLRVIGKYLAILPPECCINSEEGTYSLNGFYKWYTISVLVFIIIGYSLSVWGRFKEIYNTFPSNTLVVTDIGLNVSAIITNILSITLPSMVYLKQYGTFFKTFQDLDMHFTENGPEMKRHRFYTFFAVTHILFISLSLYNAYIWNTSYGFVVYRYYIFENIQNYHIFIMVITIFILTRAIAQRFKRINTALEELTLNSKIYVRSLHCNADLTKWELFETVRQLSTFYEKQIAQVHLFNEVFGWQILFLSLYIIMGLLNALDILILFGSLDLSEVGNGIHVDELTGINILWACWQFVSNIVRKLFFIISCFRALELLLLYFVAKRLAKLKALRTFVLSYC